MEARYRPEVKDKPEAQEVLNERFKNSLLVIGLSALSAHSAAKDQEKDVEQENTASDLEPAEWVAIATSALAPVVLPIIEFGEALTEVHLEAGD